jgi:hypothetical protein
MNICAQVASLQGRSVLADNIHLIDKGGALVLGLLRPFLDKTVVPKN